jgi:hypothetical protein
MYQFWRASAALLLCATVAWAFQDTKEKAKDADDPQAAVDALKKERDKVFQEQIAKYRAAKTSEEREAAKAEFYKRTGGLAGRFLAIAEKHAKAPAAFEALILAVTFGQDGKEGAKAAELLVANHLEHEQLSQQLVQTASSPSPVAEKLFRSVLEKSTKKEVQGVAAFALARHLRSRSDEAAKQKNKAEADKLAAEAEKFYVQVVEKFADVKIDNTPLAEPAKGELYEFKFLTIGRTAPETQGEDSDGKKFKLGDYRGKVVVLDFWAGW